VTPVVALDGVRVAHGPRMVLDVPALAVHEGEVLGVMGPNGAGKSTLLRVLGLLEAPTSGSVRFRGEPVAPAGGLAVRRRMASVFQDPLLADATVFANVALGLRFRGEPGDRIEARVMRWLDRFGIAVLARRHARTLSGGEAQRAALARALVVEPDLLLLDEPFSALDQPTRDALIGDLRSVLRAERTTAVLVTHHRGEALALGDRLAVLIGGALLQVGPAARVFRAPASAEVARFVGVETMVECEAVGRSGPCSILVAGGHRVEVAAPAVAGERVLLCLRPEDVTVRAGAAPAGSAPGLNRLPGRVRQLMPAPLHVRVVVDCGFPVVALVTHRFVQESELGEGAFVTAEFAASAPHLLRPGHDAGAPRNTDPGRLDTAVAREV